MQYRGSVYGGPVADVVVVVVVVAAAVAVVVAVAPVELVSAPRRTPPGAGPRCSSNYLWLSDALWQLKGKH